MRIAAVSDLHGLKPRFALLGRLFEQGIDTLLVAGDVARAGYPVDQREDVEENFGRLLEGREAGPGLPCYFFLRLAY